MGHENQSAKWATTTLSVFHTIACGLTDDDVFWVVLVFHGQEQQNDEVFFLLVEVLLRIFFG